MRYFGSHTTDNQIKKTSPGRTEQLDGGQAKKYAERCAKKLPKESDERSGKRRSKEFTIKHALVAALAMVAVALPCTAVPVGFYAEEAAQSGAVRNDDGTALADVSGTAEKQEVVYAALGTEGTPQSMYVVNVLDGVAGEVVQDFGAYDQVVNLTDTSQLAHASDSVVFTMPEGGFTYQGSVASASLPWNIDITYRLDGQEISAQDLAGKSGELELSIKTTQNTAVDPRYFENYLMQITCTLPMDKAQSIKTDQGSIAISGSNVTVSFMVIPESEGSLSLTATVNDFEMEGMSFAAIPFSMALDFPDTDSLISSFDVLIDGTEQLHEGAQQLASGAESVDEATKQAASGAAELASGSAQLAQGLQQYQQGLRDSAAEAEGSVDQGEIDAATEAYRAALGQYAAMFAATYEQIKEANPNMSSEEALAAAAKQLEDSEVEQALTSSLETLLTLTSTSVASKGAAEALNQAADGLGSPSDAASLLGGAVVLDQGTQELASGLDQLAGGTGQLSSGVDALSSGTQTLAQETQGIPDAVNAEIEALMSTYDKSDFEPASFTSSKNTNVTLVQFVMTTDPIKVNEPEPADEPEQEETIADRFFALFS